MDDQKVLTFIGTYNNSEDAGKGIHCGFFSKDQQTFQETFVYEDIENPTYIEISPDKKFLYAVSEITKYNGSETGLITSFSIDAEKGGLTLLNQKITEGTMPCHISIDQTQSCLLVSNYGKGGVTVFSIEGNGALSERSQFIPYQSGEKKAHTHSAMIDKNNKYVMVQELGLDRIFQYQLDINAKQLLENEIKEVILDDQSGPRHFTFHPNRDFAYVINELNSTVIVYQYNLDRGVLTEIQRLSTLPQNFSGDNYPAHLCITPCGNYLYGTNRGHDSLVIFSIDQNSGTLKLVGHESTGGAFPRHFSLVPGTNLLLVANQNSNNIVCFDIDTEKGLLTKASEIQGIGKPVCIKHLN